MKSHELRLGNWVMGNNPYQIEMAQLVTMEYNEKVGLPEYCSAIPLTPEWLNKFGWKKELTDWELEGYWFTKGRKWTISAKNEFYNGVYSQKIEYVHQLQNLFYALTGKELIARTQNK